jgi:acetoacetate decarboxylase
LTLAPHALAPVAELPVLEVVTAVHMICDLTLGLGKVAYDYLETSAPATRAAAERAPARAK